MVEQTQDIPTGDESASVAVAPAAPAAPEISPEQAASDEKAHENKMMKMQRILAAQPKVSVRVPKTLGPQSVIINGARYNIPAGIPVDVPQDVAEQLRNSEII